MWRLQYGAIADYWRLRAYADVPVKRQEEMSLAAPRNLLSNFRAAFATCKIK
jgi:hypothetical protein